MTMMLRAIRVLCLSSIGVASMLGQARAQDAAALAPGVAPRPTTEPAPAGPLAVPAQPFALQLPQLTPPAQAPRPHHLGAHLLHLDPRSVDQNRREEVLIGQPLGLTPGFLNLHIPDQITPATMGLELGIFAGKMMLLQSLCGLGRCRVNTGPGDVPMGWVEEFADTGASAASRAPSQRLRSGR